MNSENKNSNKDIKIKTDRIMYKRNLEIARKMKAVEISRGGKRYSYNQIVNGGWLIEGYNPY